MFLVVLLLAASGFAQQTPDNAWKAVDDAFGRKGAPQPGDVYKFSMPRSDLKVTVAGVAIQPALALGSWAAFKRMGNAAVVMGDLVLAEKEVPNVIAGLQKGGISVTAIHNHLLGETPRVMYVHISGHGDAVQLARTLHDALAATGTPPPAPAPSAAAPVPAPTLAAAELDEVLGRTGKMNGSVYQLTVARAQPITEDGMAIPPSMGVATSINIQPAQPGRAAGTGDFVLIASEVNPVIQALREHKIAVTALHSHMLDEQPRLFFLHFWVVDTPQAIATGLKAALDHVATAK